MVNNTACCVDQTHNKTNVHSVINNNVLQRLYTNTAFDCLIKKLVPIYQADKGTLPLYTIALTSQHNQHAKFIVMFNF